ncbi:MULTISPECIES: hypothetical protein [unclassified Haladaptatus]|uniref:DUF7312 domain-containing protein n=1 Tax=unclassified Haladaptatus TaxID=2622732 RepID=UPI00209BF526|nr:MULTISPECIES: hypothetical protein [unclassified Haladaptatus]MCO8244508.1 hypothetical protein [Haladaptatus sp. AB643]MCO8253870.1 hypothetical protein [Haladaptatus sp. AB618]
MSDWKYDVEDVGEDADDTPSDIFSEEEPLEPGSPSAENVLFVLLGALTVLYVFLHAIGVA